MFNIGSFGCRDVPATLNRYFHSLRSKGLSWNFRHAWHDIDNDLWLQQAPAEEVRRMVYIQVTTLSPITFGLTLTYIGVSDVDHTLSLDLRLVTQAGVLSLTYTPSMKP